MKVTIALIGSQEFCKQAETIDLSQNIRIDCYEYDHPSEAPNLVKNIKPCHAILFSGSLPYEASKTVLKTLSVPSLYLRQNEHTIAVTLLYLASEKNIAIYDISIDIKDRTYIEQILRDMDTLSANKKPAIHELQTNGDLQAVVNFHLEQFRSGKTKMAVTSVHAVYDQLKAAGIPAFRMLDPASNTLRALEHAAQQANLVRSEATKIAVGLLKIHKSEHFTDEMVEKLASHLQAQWSKEDDCFYFYTTLGTIEFALSLESFSQFIETLGRATLSFGLGQTIVEASDNARSALKLSSEDGIFMLDEHKQLHGPLPSTNPSIAMKLEDPRLLAMSKKTTVSPAVISKLIQFDEFRQSSSFTAHDLASYLEVSRRTAERTIKKFMDQQFIQTVGEEMTYSQGRPRTLYKMKFPMS